VNSWNASGRLPRTFLDGEGNLRLVLEVALRLGITEAHLRSAIESFDIAILVLFLELALSACSCEDPFQQRALLDACREGLERTLDVSRAWPILGVIGMARPMNRTRA